MRTIRLYITSQTTVKKKHFLNVLVFRILKKNGDVHAKLIY